VRRFIGIGNDSWSVVLSSKQQNIIYKNVLLFLQQMMSLRGTTLDGIYFQKISNEQPQILFNVFKYSNQ
jgi:hypothetical protein